MDTKQMVLLGVNGAVVAFERATGKRLWEQRIAKGGAFVTLLSDEQQVFAHSKGELYCLNLQTGQLLWQDKLKGMGYGTASLALPGGATSDLIAAMEESADQERQNDRNMDFNSD